MRNENGYRFHSHQSTANLNLRTQSATIPNTLIAKVFYIYKKWKCVELLTIPGGWLTGSNSVGMIGTSIKHMPIEHTQTQSSRGGRKFRLIRTARSNGWAG